MRLLTLTVAIGLTLAGCSTSPEVSSTVEEPPWEPLEIALTLYLVEVEGQVAQDGGPLADSNFATQRSEEDLAMIGANMATIWAQAGVIFEPLNVRTVSIPAELLGPIVSAANAELFFRGTFDVADAGVINGFYVREAAGVNGFAPRNSRIFFVVDEPTVNDERVSSHEVGHIFGLHHELEDPDRLMFSGTNGTILTEAEQQVARYGAQGILDNQR